MATQNVNIGINVSDNGTAKKVVKSFEEITSAAQRAQRSATSINIPVKSSPAPASGTQGSRRASQPTGMQQQMDNQGYGQARGSAGLTGASARDFANQAQGLGGLVRLYATLAANIFAASAAYTALSNAMDTTNLVKGLDMLGATAGRNLGTLSKRLVEVTDGAVSMRDAMTATAQASSAGMTNKNIERLAQVAKNASLALGVAMPDALSRLSRGIVKLEPELLDELGLFTKIGPATERYALEIGKAVGQLTDFERRQAFANAVLEEGEKKFGALSEAASNPYDKLLATLKNVLQSGGELINKVLVPIVSLLAESPSALGAVIAGLGVVLLKQALPAIGQMRAGLRNTAEEALETAKAFKESFGDEFQTRLEKRFKLPSLEADVKKAEADLAKLKMPRSVGSLVDRQGELNQVKVNEQLAKRNEIIETNIKNGKRASAAQIEAAKQEIAYINKTIDLYTKKQALQAGQEGLQTLADVAPGRFDPETIALTKYQELQSKVARANAVSNAAQNAQISGIRGAWVLLNEEVAENGVRGFQKYSTLAQGGLAAIGSRVMGLIGTFSNVAMAVGFAVAGFQLLDSWLTKNAKQTENFNKALTTADDSVANVTRTLSAATSIEGFGTRTIANTAAFSNALTELTSSASEVIKLAREADRAAGLWDNLWDSVFSVFDRDRASKLAKTVADQIKSSVKILQREGLADEYKVELKKILNVDSLEDTKKVAEAFKSLSKTQQDAILQLQNNANRALGNASSLLETFKTSTDAALRAQKTFANSFIDSSPMFMYGQSLITVSQGLTKIIAAGPDRVVQALEEVATNTEKMGLFGKTFVESFAGISNAFLQQTKNINASRIALVEYQNALEQANRAAAAAAVTPGAGFAQTGGGAAVGRPNADFSRTTRTQANASVASSDLREVQRAINAQQDGVVKQAIELAKQAAKAIYEEGLAYINKAIREAQNAAAITVGRALTVNLTGVQKIEADNRLRQQEIKYQLASIDVSEQVLDVQSSLVSEMRLANALQAEANTLLKNRGKEDQGSLDQNAEASRQVALARGRLGDTSGLSAIDAAQVARDKRDADDLRRKGTQAQRVALGAQSTVSTIGVAAQRPGAEVAQAEELAKIDDRRNASLLARSQILNSITGTTNVELTAARQAVELAQTENKQKRELAEINAKIKAATDLQLIAEKQNNEEGRAAVEDQKTQIAQLQQIKKRTEEAQRADLSAIRAKNTQELLSDQITTIGRRTELERSSAQLQNTLAQTALDTRSQEFALYSSAYDVSRQVVVSQQAALDIQKSQLETNTAIAQAEAELQVKRDEAEARRKALAGDTTGIAAVNAELERQVALTNNTIAGLTAQGAAKTSILEKTRAINLEQERYNHLLSLSEGLASSLGELFGELGASLGGVTKAFTEIAISSERRAKAEELAVNARINAQSTGNEEDILRTQKALEDTRKKNAREALSDDIKLVNSTKKVFKEKTGAYKILNGIEKVMHVTRLAMDLKELAIKISTTTAGLAVKAGAETAETGMTLAGTMARLPAYAAEIYGKTIGQLGPIAGPVVATGLVAAMFSMFGKGGGGGAGAFVPNAEQRQETQGTGQTWDSAGNKVDTGGGVFGDSSQKLDSINKGIQTMKDNSIEGLFYDNRMLKALERIAQSITGAAQSLYSTPGIRTGLNFGSLPGTTMNTNWYQDIPLIGGALGSIFGGGTSASATIQDAGIQLRGTLDDLANGFTSGIRQYKDILTEFREDGGWFGSDDYWTTLSRETQAVNADIRSSFADVFKDAKNMFTQVADVAGISSAEVNRVFQSITTNLDISLKGLTGEDVLKELNATISGELDKVAKQLFSSFDKFKKFGEGYTDTVIRVVDGNNKVDAALRAMGSSFDVTKDKVEKVTATFGGGWFMTAFTFTLDAVTSKFEISETIINKMAGSLENFTDQAKFFIDNFLTESERMANTRQGVNKALGELGLSTDISRDNFKQLVQMQDLSTQTGRDMYQGLMDIQEGFFKVTQRLTDLNKETENLQIELLKAQGRTQEADSALRTLATEGMTQTELSVYDYNDSLKQQIEALKQAETVTNQRISLEQRLFQLGNDVVALRAIELNKLDETNRGLQLQIWVLEDYNKVLASSSAAIEKATQSAKAAEDAAQAVQNRATDQYVAATEKVAAAQKSIADLAVEAAKRMQGFGKSLRDFVKSQLLPSSTGQNASQAFAQNTRLALTGDVSAIEKVPELAQAAIDAAKASARSSEEFNSTRAAILAGVTNVAKFAEAQASLTNIPADEDPLVVANRALEDAIREQTRALSVANTIGASLVKAPEDLIAEYKKANQDLATAIVEKALAKEAQARAQAALDTIAGNTGNLITAITGTTTETSALAKVVETELKSGVGKLDANLDGKLTFDELSRGLKGKATDDQIKDLIKAADLNKDSVVDAYELELFNSTKSIVEALGSGFQMLDTNLDGKVSEAEFIKGMTGKASDAALKTIFDLVDGDNNKIITATELTAAQSALTATNSADLSLIKDGVAGQIIATDTAATETSNAITALNNENLLTITNNTATTVQAINLLLNNNVALFNAMNAVAANTKSLADSVTAGSGQAASGSASGGNFLSTIGKAVGGVVSGVIGAVGSVVSGVGKAIKKLFSDERTKKNISLHSRLSNGIGIYDYNYKEPYAGIYGSDRKRGVLAQEVKEDYPGAVSVARNGMYMVDYSKLPVPLEMLKFARGGVFSNQVVTRPTSFSLAQMGEAGPEAIMPLSRTRNGRLGVVSQTEPDNAFNAQIQNQNTALIEEVRKLREEVNLLRFEARATASATGKTTRILERVTQNGDSLLVTDAATV